MLLRRLLPGVLILVLGGCVGSGPAGPGTEAPGSAKSAGTRVLETGAAALQRDTPADSLEIYLVGFHPLKDDPTHQFEAHHFCRQVTEDFMQCVLYDGNTREANLNGIEYIISEHLFQQLPEAERRYWHPHNGEILSGLLVAPGLPGAAETALMKTKINSYGKTWHTWNTSHTGSAGSRLPLGEPALAWSFNRFGEANPGLVEERDRRLGVSTEARRQARQELVPLARPQRGVDALGGAFPGPTSPIPGVVDQQTATR
jgi:hypothetical protein